LTSYRCWWLFDNVIKRAEVDTESGKRILGKVLLVKFDSSLSL